MHKFSKFVTVRFTAQLKKRKTLERCLELSLNIELNKRAEHEYNLGVLFIVTTEAVSPNRRFKACDGYGTSRSGCLPLGAPIPDPTSDQK